VDDVAGAMAGHVRDGADFRILLGAFRQPFDRSQHRLTHLLHPHCMIRHGAGTARILNVLLPA
jgi:hypothetical protein